MFFLFGGVSDFEKSLHAKELLWLSVVEGCAARGFLIPLPHFHLATTTFARDEEGACRHLFLTLVLDREQGTVVEIHTLGRAKQLLETLKFLHGSGTLTQVDDNLLTLRVPGSKCLYREASHLTAALMEDQFDDKDIRKEEERAESRSFATLMVSRRDEQERNAFDIFRPSCPRFVINAKWR